MRRTQIGKAMNASQQSQVNISLVFNFLRENGAANRAKIAERLSLSVPAVSRAVEMLEEGDRIIKWNTDDSSARKGTPVYRINPRFGYVIAVDLAQNRSQAMAVDYNGNVVAQISGFKPGNSHTVVDDLFLLINECVSLFIQNTGEKRSKITAIAVGVAAAVNRTTGRLQISYYDGYEEIRFEEVLEDRFGIPTFVENICSLSAFAERKRSIRSENRSLIFVEIGNAIGAGIIIDGGLYHGNGFAGEIGFSITSPEQTKSLVGKKGYLEKNASLSALVHSVRYELACGVESSLIKSLELDDVDISAELIFEHAAHGDQLCFNAVSDMASNLAVAIHNAVAMLNPPIVILGGDICYVTAIEALLIEPIRHKLAESLPFAPPEIVLTELGAEAGIQGAASLAFDSILLREFPYYPDST